MKLQRLQVLRAVAATLVVWVHAVNLASHDAVRPWQARIGYFEHFGAAGVDIFFVISGFIIALGAGRAKTAGDFFVRRLLRIWPLYAALSLLLLALRLAGHFHPDWSLLASSLLFLQRPGHAGEMPFLTLGWSLMFEMYFYTVVALALAWPARLSGGVPLLGRVALLLGGMMLLGAVTHFRQPLNIWGNPVILEFLLGVVVSQVWQRRSVLPREFAPLSLLLGAGLLLLSGYRGFGQIAEAPLTLDGSLSVPRLLQWGVPSALLVLGVVCLRAPWRDTRLGRAAVFLGDASYSIYLSSFITLALLLQLWPHLSRLGGDAGILVALTLTLLAGAACYLLLEKPLARLTGTRIGWLPACRVRPRRAAPPAGAPTLPLHPVPGSVSVTSTLHGGD